MLTFFYNYFRLQLKKLPFYFVVFITLISVYAVNCVLVLVRNPANLVVCIRNHPILGPYFSLLLSLIYVAGLKILRPRVSQN